MSAILSFGVLVALTIGITEVIKRAGKVPTRFIPLIALVVGFGLTLIGDLTTLTSVSILTGIAVGLSACGLFDQKLIVVK